MQRFSTFAFLCLLLCSVAASTQAQDNPERGYSRFEKHTVYYSVFSSTAIKPEIARLHDITRGANRVLINVAVVPNDGATAGRPAQISGHATNLMQQRRELKFQTIAEENATYYLAPLRVTEDEMINFTLRVQPEGSKRAYTVKFSKRLYVNE